MSTPEIAETIADSMNTWLREEVASSGEGVNAYIDAFSGDANNLRLSAEDPNNINYTKWRDHFNRQRQFSEGVLMLPKNDLMASKSLFNVMMQMSGCFRRIALLQASDASNYMEIRTGENASGIDLESTVRDRIKLLEEVELPVPVHPIDALTMSLNGITNAFSAAGTALEALTLRNTETPEDLGLTASPSLDILHDSQTTWANSAVDYIAAIAALRDGDISSVPLLHPMSIGDQPPHMAAVIYPFLQNWQYNPPTRN